MEIEIIISLIIGFLVMITLIRRSMLKPKPADRRENIRRYEKRRTKMGRRHHEFSENCDADERRKEEERRAGVDERRHNKSRRH